MTSNQQKELYAVIRIKYGIEGSCYVLDSELIEFARNFVSQNGIQTNYRWECEKNSCHYGSDRYWAIKHLENLEKQFAMAGEF